jgi:NodT family efflux transporter outer membrane factor (OMF) lipoprotein
VHPVLTHHDEEQRKIRRPLVVGGWLSLCVAALLSGCAVGPKYVKPVTSANHEWSEKSDPRLSTQTPADSAWWRAFNDPALDSLVERAYHQNLSLQVAGLRIMEARAQLGIAVGNQYPQVQAAFGSAAGVQLSKNAPNSVLADHDYWDYQLGFDAEWEIDFWRKFARGVQAAEASYLASVADYDDALVSLTAEVARTYAVIRTFEVLLDQARQNVTVQEEGQRIAQSRFRNGATSELDVTQATTLLENTRSTIPQLEAGLQQAENALSTLLGQPTGAVRAILGRPGPIPAAPPQVSVSVPTEMLRRRPDIRSAELAAVAQCARIGIATADLYPSFSLFGQIGYQTSSSGGPLSNNASFSNLFDPGSLFFFYGPRLVWPLFNYGRIRNNVRVEDARFQQSLVAYQNTVLRAAQEAEDGMVGFLRAQEATVFAQNAATAAKRSVDLAFVQYREGAVDFQRVLDAQRSLLQEQNGLAQTQSSAATSLIALYKALGGGWEMRRGQPFVADSTRIQMQHRTNWGNLFQESQAPETSNQKSHKR